MNRYYKLKEFGGGGMERLKYTCHEDLLPTKFSFWPIASSFAVILLGAFLEYTLNIQNATMIAAFVVLVITLITASLLIRNNLSKLPCSKCGATSLEQSSDNENILLICHSCQIIWITNLTIK